MQLQERETTQGQGTKTRKEEQQQKQKPGTSYRLPEQDSYGREDIRESYGFSNL